MEYSFCLYIQGLQVFKTIKRKLKSEVIAKPKVRNHGKISILGAYLVIQTVYVCIKISPIFYIANPNPTPSRFRT